MIAKQAANESQNNLQVASFGIRMKAFAYDCVLILAYSVVLAGVNYGIILSRASLEKVSPAFASVVVKDAIAFLTLILPVMLYFTLQESSPSQATWGKRKVGLRVVDEQGERLSRWKAFLRAAIKFLPWQIAHTSIYQADAGGFGSELPPVSLVGFSLAYILVGIYLLSILISKNHRAPYDLAVGSFVVAGALEKPKRIDKMTV